MAWHCHTTTRCGALPLLRGPQRCHLRGGRKANRVIRRQYLAGVGPIGMLFRALLGRGDDRRRMVAEQSSAAGLGPSADRPSEPALPSALVLARKSTASTFLFSVRASRALACCAGDWRMEAERAFSSLQMQSPCSFSQSQEYSRSYLMTSKYASW
mmetsp:Transcript_32633/g.69547  ORF Transcript_32633/g.69547 Transcript_32633/m.69547 type:complete len:156 (-) Transcript_32633:19-486(-)